MSQQLARAKAPSTTLRLVRSFQGHLFPRITLWCPEGHEVVDTPLESGLGRRLAEGDYRGEDCYPCGWSGGER